MSIRSTHIGQEGERLAHDYLVGLGFDIIARNYRYGRWEVDVIALRDETLHFIEVKTRTQSSFGLPETAVDNKKIQRMLAVASHFQQDEQQAIKASWRYIQFDIVAIELYATGEKIISYIEDIYTG